MPIWLVSAKISQRERFGDAPQTPECHALLAKENWLF
jgi:hypothetical protein